MKHEVIDDLKDIPKVRYIDFRNAKTTTPEVYKSAYFKDGELYIFNESKGINFYEVIPKEVLQEMFQYFLPCLYPSNENN